MTNVRFLSSDELDGIATPEEFVEAVREAYRQRGTGAAAKPRTTLTNEDPAGMLTGYQAILPDTGMGGYMYSAGFEAGDAWFLTPLFDPQTGEPEAILDGAWFNPYKTGAAGAVAVDALARKDASTMAVIGSGAQARGQLRATATVRDLETVWVYSPTADNRESFAAEHNQELDASVAAVASSAAAVEDADIIVTATTASEPVIDSSNIEEGTHITAMGQYDPDARELDAETIARSIYVPDLRDRVTQDAGSFLAALEAGMIEEDHIHAELGEVLVGTAPGRTDPDAVTIFDSGGTAIETVAGARLCYDRAVEAGLGTTISVAPASDALTGR